MDRHPSTGAATSPTDAAAGIPAAVNASGTTAAFADRLCSGHHAFWLLLLLPFLVYAWALPYGLLRIDDLVQYHAPLLHDGGWYGLIDVWLRPWFYDYSPVTLVTQWLDRALGDDRDHWISSRLQNPLWLGLGALGIHAFFRRIAGAHLALAVAVLYVLHPLCADGTLWLAERKNLVALALSFWCCERYVACRGDSRVWTGIAAVVLGVLALLAKPHAVAIPVMLAAWELMLGSEGQGVGAAWRRARAAGAAPGAMIAKAARSSWPAIVLTVVVAAFVVWQMTQRRDIGAAFLGGSRLAAGWCDGWILARYLGMVVDPRNLTLYYPVVEDPHAVVTLGLCWAAVAAAVITTVALARRRRLVLFAWMFALAALAPALNLIAQNVPMTDYYLQWALPGLLLVLVVVAADVVARVGANVMRLGPVLVVAAAVGSAALSLQRLPEFSSRETFFTVAMRRQPETAVNIGGYVYDRVRYHDGRYQPANGELALHAATLPSAGRMLAFTVPDTAIEAGVAAWRQGGRAAADAAIAEFPVPGPDTDLGVAVAARVLIGASLIEPAAGHLAEAEAMLSQRLGNDLLAQADALGARCRAGDVLPDAVAPVADIGVNPGNSDEYLQRLDRHDHLRLLVALSEARERAGDGPGAFAAAALALNLDPADGDARVAASGLYARALHRGDLAQRVLDAGR
jgi:hypothetical protein